MENPLSGLISGTTKRPIIVNGQLLTDNGQLVTARRDKYRVEFSRLGPNRQDVILENGNELLDSMAERFNQKYGQALGVSGDTLTTFTANVDTFTGAIVLRNAVYDMLVDEDNSQHFHDGTYQFNADVRNMLNAFLVDSTVNYFEIYSKLMNRRLMASYMPIVVKGHLVAGLFQPLVVQTRFIRTPLRFGDFDWFFTYLNNPDTVEEYLERPMETSRNLELTVVAMCDLVSRFGVPNVQELSRLHWMFMLLTCLLAMSVPAGVEAMVSTHKNVWIPIKERHGKNAQVYGFFNALLEAMQRIRNTIAVQ